MKTPKELALVTENELLSKENAMLLDKIQMLQEKYDSLCVKIKTNANKLRNDDDFLSSYAKDTKGPWN